MMTDILKYSSEDYNFHISGWQQPKQDWFSQFDEIIRKKWDESMDAGMFRYNLSEVQERIIPGQYNFITQLNTKRGVQRRKPEDIQSMQAPFNPEKFNFSKVNPREVLFEMVNTGGKECDTSKEHTLSNGVGVDRHQLLINVSPLEYGHILLVPSIDNGTPQVLTEIAVKTSIELMLLSKHPGFRVGFNSLCAFASVNHLHLHAWYVQHQIATETADVNAIGKKCYTTSSYPCKAFVVQLHGSSIEEFSRQVFIVADLLQKKEVAHNVFFTRGREINHGDLNTIRVYVWPRHSVFGAKFEGEPVDFNLAVAELGGQVPVYYEDRFPHLTEDDIVKRMKEWAIPEEQFLVLQQDLLAALN